MWKTEEERQIEKPKTRLRCNVKTDLKEIGWRVCHWIAQAQDQGQVEGS
jgi:hypothetical protein